jgi:transcription initiation factor IIF auxiliary subunit
MIFLDDNDRQAAVQHLPTLKDHPAWKYLERALDENIEHFTEQLKTKKGFSSVEEFEAIQDRLSDIEKFRDLPDTLLKEALNVIPEQEDDPDPYPVPDLDDGKSNL